MFLSSFLKLWIVITWFIKSGRIWHFSCSFSLPVSTRSKNTYLWDYNFLEIFLVTNWQNMVTSDDDDSDMACTFITYVTVGLFCSKISNCFISILQCSFSNANSLLMSPTLNLKRSCTASSCNYKCFVSFSLTLPR